MAISPPDRTQTFWAAQTTITISGVTYAAIADITVKWGYKIHEEVVTGTNNPYLGTGVFHGEVTLDGIGSPDNRWENLIAITSGVVSTYGFTWRESDTTATLSGARTWTASGKFTDFEHKFTKDGAVMFKTKGILGLAPTVSQS